MQPVDAFAPNYTRFPRFGEAQCADVIVQPGEIIYYPAYWFHQTRCLDEVTTIIYMPAIDRSLSASCMHAGD